MDHDNHPLLSSFTFISLFAALERLDDMCIVLGVDYKKKLLEMGVTSMDELDLDVKRV